MVRPLQWSRDKKKNYMILISISIWLLMKEVLLVQKGLISVVFPTYRLKQWMVDIKPLFHKALEDAKDLKLLHKNKEVKLLTHSFPIGWWKEIFDICQLSLWNGPLITGSPSSSVKVNHQTWRHSLITPIRLEELTKIADWRELSISSPGCITVIILKILKAIRLAVTKPKTKS